MKTVNETVRRRLRSLLQRGSLEPQEDNIYIGSHPALLTLMIAQMQTTGTFIIHQPLADDFLAMRVEGEDINHLAWCSHPAEAVRYPDFESAAAVAQEIAINQGYLLVVCELFESETQFQPVGRMEYFPLTNTEAN